MDTKLQKINDNKFCDIVMIIGLLYVILGYEFNSRLS